LSVRDLSRHRAQKRAATPLSEFSEALTGQLAIVGRSGAIVAMSTGLVASAGVSAHAAGNTTSTASTSSVDTSAASAMTVTAMSTGRSSLMGSANLARGAVIAAPSAATVSFETEAFKAVPKPKPAPVRKALKNATTTSSGSATKSSSRTGAPSYAPAGSASGSSVLAVAARYVGIPYVYGGTTPRGFDCSGYTSYVYRQVGISLPRTANQQLQASKQISRSNARPGDLVFFTSGGRAYHVGIYAGGNMMYDSPRTGKTTGLHVIWTQSNVSYGRF
jgi:cell wall-associated NlpC family hydrolase